MGRETLCHEFRAHDSRKLKCEQLLRIIGGSLIFRHHNCMNITFARSLNWPQGIDINLAHNEIMQSSTPWKNYSVQSLHFNQQGRGPKWVPRCLRRIPTERGRWQQQEMPRVRHWLPAHVFGGRLRTAHSAALRPSLPHVQHGDAMPHARRRIRAPCADPLWRWLGVTFDRTSAW